MPVIDLNATDAIMRGGTTIDALYRGAALVWSAAPAGPLRTPIATTDTVGFEGNSQLVLIPGPEHGGQFDTIWPGTVARTFEGGGSLGGISDGEISVSVWSVNGAGRNADFSAGGYLCINEGLLSSQFASGFPDPGTAQDNVTLQYVGGYLREATRIGADALVIVSNYPHRDFPLWDEPLQHAQFWRAHAMIHNPGDVWIFPLTWLIQDAVDYYGTTAVYVDPVHLNEGTYPALLLAISYAFEYFCTRALPTSYGSLTGDTLALVDRFMPIVAGYRYAGFGGANAPADLLYLGEPLSVSNDPLPSPGTLPGEGATVPAQPAAPTFSALGADTATVSWVAPDDGGSAITSYTLEWREVGGATTTITDATSPEVLTGLDPETDHEARVTAINAIGSSTPSAWGEFTTAAAAVAPSFVTLPSITPATGTAGQVYALDLGTYAGDAPITPTWTLTHSVDGDVTGDVVAGDYDSTGATAGTLTLSVSLSNAAGTAGPETDTATVSAAPTGPTRVFEITTAPYSGPTLTGTLPAVTDAAPQVGGYRTFTTGPAPALGAALSLSDQVHVVMALRIRNRTNNDIHVLSALHDGDPLSAPHVYLIANDYVGGWMGVVATPAASAQIEGANFGGYSADSWLVVQEDVDLGTVRGAVNNVDGAAPGANAAITAWATSQLSMFVSQSGNAITVDVAAFGIYDAALDATGRDAAWAWASSYIPQEP